MVSVCVQSMYEKLTYWTGHSNREIQHLGMLALEAFLRQVCISVCRGAAISYPSAILNIISHRCLYSFAVADLSDAGRAGKTWQQERCHFQSETRNQSVLKMCSCA